MKHDTNNYWEQLERLEKLIRASELKAGIIFSFHSLILGMFVDRMTYLQSIFSEHSTFIIVAILWVICVLISIFYCFKCFRPRMELKFNKNVFFFKDAISAFGNCDTYSKKLIDVCANEDQIVQQLSEQIFVESKIIDQKFRCIQNSLKYFAISFILFLMLVALWILTL